jgi:hypothetical protein
VGCGDSTAPPPPLGVEISVYHLDTPVIGTTEDGFPIMTCEVEFRANASGAGSAEWLGAKALWFTGTDRSTPLDSSVVSSSEVRTAWQKTGIAAGETQFSVWTFTYGAPFTASVKYSYKPEGDDAKTAVVEFSCGPTTDADTPDPSITELTAAAVAGELEPGDTLTVDYTATSPTGIWQTAVVLSGPCEVQQLFAEQLETKLTRSTRIPLPAECRLGVPINVTVFARDAGLQTGARVLHTDVSLVDETPPSIAPMFLPSMGSASSDLAGVFFGGDSISVVLHAWDNHALQSLHWEILPAGMAADGTLEVTGASTSSTIRIPLPLDASGQIQLRLYARDAAGLTSNVVTTTAGAAKVYPTVERATEWAAVDGEVWDAVVDTRRGVAYLLQPNQGRISVLSLSTMTVTGSIRMPSFAPDFDITAGGDSLIAVLPVDHALGVIDLRQASPEPVLIPLTLLDATLDQHPAHVRTLSNGKAFVSLAGSMPTAYVLMEVDLATGAQTIRADAGESGYVGGGELGRSLDHSVVVVNGGPTYFQRYDVATNHFGARKSASVYDVTPVLDATGRYVAVGLDVYDQSLEHLRRVSSPVLPGGVIATALSANGEVLHQMLSTTGLIRSRVSDGAILDRTINPIGALEMRISDDGTVLMTTVALDYNSSKVSTIDVR